MASGSTNIKSSFGGPVKIAFRRVRRIFRKKPKHDNTPHTTPIAAGKQPMLEGPRLDIEGGYSSCGDGRRASVGAASSTGRSTAFLRPPSRNADFGAGSSRPSSVAACEDPDDVNCSTWEIAFKRARERLDAREQTLLDELSVSKKENLPTSILVEAQRAQQDKDHRKWKYKRSNGQVVVFRDRFDGAVRGIATFANIVGIAINHSPEVTALVWASIRFLLQLYLNRVHAIEEIDKVMQTVLTKLADCEQFASIYSGYLESVENMTPLSGDHQHWIARVRKALPELYTSIIVFLVKVQGYFSCTALQSIGHSFKPFDLEFDPYIQAIDLAEKDIERLSTIATQKGVQGIRDVGSKIDALKSGFETIMSEALLQAEKLNVERWLSAINPETQYEINRYHLLKGTCEWIFQRPEYQAWIDLSGPATLWISGIPGAGKSVLASHMVDRLHQQGDHVLLYFFYKESDPRTQSNIEMLACLVAQLLDHGHELDRFIGILKASVASRAYYQDRGRTYDQLLATFRDLIAGYEKAIIIILDALDECPEHGRIAQIVPDIAGPNVRICLTGRVEVHKLFSSMKSTVTVKMSVLEDIRKYITEKVEGDAALRMYREDIIKTADENSEGMFRYAALLLEELTAFSRRTITERLALMPKGIEGMYALIIERLYKLRKDNEEEAAMFRNMLSWMVVAPIPMAVCEMQWMLITSPGENFDPARIVVPSAELMRECCGSLIELAQVGAANAFEGSNDDNTNSVDAGEREATGHDNRQIRFTHRTVKEFLTDIMNTKENPLLSVVLPDINTTTLELVLICLTQLSSNSAIVTQTYEKYPREYMHAQFSGLNTPLSFAALQWIELLRGLDEYFGHSYVTKLEENLWHAFDRLGWGDSNSVRNSQQFPLATDRYRILGAAYFDSVGFINHGEDGKPRTCDTQGWFIFRQLGLNAVKRAIKRGIQFGAPDTNGYYLISFVAKDVYDADLVRVLADVDYRVVPQKSYHPLLGVSESPEKWKTFAFNSLLRRLQATLDYMDKDGSTLLGISLNTVSLVCMYMSSGAKGPDHLTEFEGEEILKSSIEWIKVLWKHGARVCQFQHHKLVFVDADLEFDDGDAVSEKEDTTVKTAASRWGEHLKQQLEYS